MRVILKDETMRSSREGIDKRRENPDVDFSLNGSKRFHVLHTLNLICKNLFSLSPNRVNMFF